MLFFQNCVVVVLYRSRVELHNLMNYRTAQVHVHWVMMLTNYLIFCHSFSFAFSLPQHQNLFQWVGSSHQVAKLLELSFSNSPSNEYSGLISFQIDWFGLLAIQVTLKSLLQHYNLKASIFQHSAFFMVQFSHDYWKHHIFMWSVMSDYATLWNIDHQILLFMEFSRQEY